MYIVIHFQCFLKYVGNGTDHKPGPANVNVSLYTLRELPLQSTVCVCVCMRVCMFMYTYSGTSLKGHSEIRTPLY